MKPWLMVDSYKHRIARHPNGPWGMYCPERGPDALIYAASGKAMLWALNVGAGCPHDEILYGPRMDGSKP